MAEFWTKAFLIKFLKFGLVGFSGLFVDYGFTFLFKEILKVQKFVANSIGFTLAATSNYFLNRVWTFQSTNPDIAVEYTEFLVISLIGLVINNLILWLMLRTFKWNFYLCKLFAIGVVTIWNFLANALFTFA
ncbi:MAG: GtrA family protein [Bacteroidales bacterium]|nr:GtrA family protein [Bacteroidales bacterium]MCF8345372.1 GtrA family protein [Bacteroidales bacterium]MCF8351118.1 GtrA family protein [Bacteroidales bacterium]MCF8374820.1 GtrA family protein [Bacteroidales bacterium]MCF8399776.1 GtrA family protein [Bacteroidales bacterium]